MSECQQKVVKLSSKTFIEQMFRYGYLSEQIPPCFSSASFAKRFDVARSQTRGGIDTAPTTLSIYKNELARRVISIPNPYSFAHTVIYMGTHWSQITRYAKSTNSQSPVTFIRSYEEESAEVLNSESAREVKGARSEYVNNLKDCIALGLGCKCMLKLDISTCYESLYTHSVSWAICGKDAAKRCFAKNFSSEQEKQLYNFTKDLDKSIRNQKRQETNGILTGPFTSRIFSELVLAGIDRELEDSKERIRFVGFRRYVDDYKFYFRSEADARVGLREIGRILGEYNFNINQSKIVFATYPFDVISPMRRELDDAFKESGVFGMLNAAGALHLAGEKGAYKYALKMMAREGIGVDSNQVLAMLFNINLVDPKYARYIVRFIKSNKKALNDQRLSDIINGELQQSLAHSLEQEALNQLYFARELGVKVRAEYVAEAMVSGSDLSAIIAADLWNNRAACVEYDDDGRKKVEGARADLRNSLRGTSLDGEHWLILYEDLIHPLLGVEDVQWGKTGDFLSKLRNCGVDFYRWINESGG